jgi:hypothetical protein
MASSHCDENPAVGNKGFVGELDEPNKLQDAIIHVDSRIIINAVVRLKL